jgi:hypothetical protein
VGTDARTVTVGLTAAVALAVTGTVAGFLAVVVLLPAVARSGEVTPVAAVLRTLLVGGAVFPVARAIARRAARAAAAPTGYDRTPVITRGAELPVFAGGLVAYALDPFTWAGRTLLGQAVAEPGVVTVVVDLVLWAAVVLLAVRAGRLTAG